MLIIYDENTNDNNDTNDDDVDDGDDDVEDAGWGFGVVADSCWVWPSVLSSSPRVSRQRRQQGREPAATVAFFQTLLE